MNAIAAPLPAPPLWRRLSASTCSRRSRSASAASSSAGSSAIASRRGASTTSTRPGRTTSRCCSATPRRGRFLVGLGFANYPIARHARAIRRRSSREDDRRGSGGTWALHRPQGRRIQYLIGIGVFFFIGGLNAMLIRTELLQPTPNVFRADQYLTLVGMHGTMMMGMMTSGILGPFANYFVPLMIGARRMAFPRIEALTFWLLMAAGVILTTTIFFGGFQTGWTGYDPLSDQGMAGMDSYICSSRWSGISMSCSASTCWRRSSRCAPGTHLVAPTDLRWSVVATALLMVLAAPVLIATLLMAAIDRTVQTGVLHPAPAAAPTCSRISSGSSGTPRSTSSRSRVRHRARAAARVRAQAAVGLPGRGRRDARGRLISFFVWQHHLFVSGINADLRPFYMLSTESSRSRRLHLPRRHGDALARADAVHRADAVLPRRGLQLPHRRRLRRLPLGRAERRHDARQLLLDGPFPLHDHGRACSRSSRRSTTGCRR